MFYVLRNVQSYTENSHSIRHISQLTCENCNIYYSYECTKVLDLHKTYEKVRKLLTKKHTREYLKILYRSGWSGRISVKYTKRRIAPHFTPNVHATYLTIAWRNIDQQRFRVTGNAVRVYHMNLSGEKHLYYLKTEIRRFQSRQWNCKLLLPKSSRPTSNNYSDSGVTKRTSAETLQLRKCCLLSTRSGVAAAAVTTTDGWPPFASIASTIPDHSATSQPGVWTSINQSLTIFPCAYKFTKEPANLVCRT